MRPSPIILIPWVLSLVLELWLVALLFRRKLYKDIPVFSAMVIIYAALDLVVLTSRLTNFYAYPMFALREISSAVLRTWLLIELCRKLLSAHVWTKRALMSALLVSAAFLIGIGFPEFLQEHTGGRSGTFFHLGVWLRTAYFTQVGVIAVLFLINFSSMLSSFTREVGMAMGLAISSAVELISMTLRSRPGGEADLSLISLNYIGMVAAVAVWIMFVSPRNVEIEIELNESLPVREVSAYSASNAAK